MDPFITEEDLEAQVGRDLSDDDSVVIALDAACDMVRTLAEQDFNYSLDTVTLDGTGTDTVLLPQTPVVSVTSVEVNGSAVTDYVVTEDGQLVRTAGSAYSTWTVCPPSFWPKGRQNIAVTYDHGYVPDDLPRDVRMVALMIAYRMITQGGATSEQVGQERRTYAVSSTDLTNGERAILAKYRRR